MSIFCWFCLAQFNSGHITGITAQALVVQGHLGWIISGINEGSSGHLALPFCPCHGLTRIIFKRLC